MHHIMPFFLLSLPTLPLINFSGNGEQWVLSKKAKAPRGLQLLSLRLRMSLCKLKRSCTDAVSLITIITIQTLHGFCDGVDAMQKSKRE